MAVTNEESLPALFKWACFEVECPVSLVHLYKLSGKSTGDLINDGAKVFGHAWIDGSVGPQLLEKAVEQLSSCGASRR